jgi:ParB family transcriptional regulator, chromosome partitioning protein
LPRKNSAASPEAAASRAREQANEPAAEWVALSALHPWDENPRKNDDAVKPVAESIKRLGFGAPIVARKNGEIIAGHTRWKAAHLLGLERVPVRYVDLDPAEAHLLALADNKLNEKADWDDGAVARILSDFSLDDAALAGFDKAELDKLAKSLDTEPADDQSGELAESYAVIIECASEEEQLEVIANCQAKGWKCRALI